MTRGAWLAALVVLGGCLLRTPDPPRFFRPSSANLDAAPVEQDARAARGVAVRLRDVRGEPFLRERIVWRTSDVEYGLYEQRRWIDLPAHYVERALRTRLRATRGLRLTDDVRAPALHVDLRAFDEVLEPTHAAHVMLAFALEDRVRGRLVERTVDSRVDIPDGQPASMAKAMGEALDDAVTQVAEGVRASVQLFRPSHPR